MFCDTAPGILSRFSSQNRFPWLTCQGFCTTGSNLHIQPTSSPPPASFSPRTLRPGLHGLEGWGEPCRGPYWKPQVANGDSPSPPPPAVGPGIHQCTISPSTRWRQLLIGWPFQPPVVRPLCTVKCLNILANKFTAPVALYQLLCQHSFHILLTIINYLIEGWGSRGKGWGRRSEDWKRRGKTLEMMEEEARDEGRGIRKERWGMKEEGLGSLGEEGGVREKRWGYGMSKERWGMRGKGGVVKKPTSVQDKKFSDFREQFWDFGPRN